MKSGFRLSTPDPGQAESDLYGTAVAAEAIGIADRTILPSDTVILATHVTCIDFIEPDGDILGTPVLKLRSMVDVLAELRESDRGRDNATRLEDAVSHAAQRVPLNVTKTDTLVVENGCVSFMFAVAALAPFYPEGEADPVTAFVQSRYRGTRAYAQLGEILMRMVDCKVYPHRYMEPYGGLHAAIQGVGMARLTLLIKGSVEGAAAAVPAYERNVVRPRSTWFSVPACAFLDMDSKMHLPPSNAFRVYFAFVYEQSTARPAVRVYVIKSLYSRQAFSTCFKRYFARERAENVRLGYRNNTRNRNPDDDRFGGEGSGTRFQLYGPHPAGGYAYRLHGRPHWSASLLGAFMQIGDVTHAVKPQETVIYETQNFGNALEVRMVTLPGFAWTFGDWTECA